MAFSKREAVLVHEKPGDGTLQFLLPFVKEIRGVHIIDDDQPLEAIPNSAKTVIVVTSKRALELTAKFHLFNRIHTSDPLSLMELIFVLKPYDDE